MNQMNQNYLPYQNSLLYRTYQLLPLLPVHLKNQNYLLNPMYQMNQNCLLYQSYR
jgi:hypothetical protein